MSAALALYCWIYKKKVQCMYSPFPFICIGLVVSDYDSHPMWAVSVFLNKQVWLSNVGTWNTLLVT